MRLVAHHRSNSRRHARPSLTGAFFWRLTALALTGALLAPSVALAGDRASYMMMYADDEATVIGAAVSSLASLLGFGQRSSNRGMPHSGRRHPDQSRPQPPLRKHDREAKVSRLEVNPEGEVTVEVGQPFLLTAIPLDREGDAIQGLEAVWETSDPKVVSVTPDGQAVGVSPGTARLGASAGHKKESVRVTVTRGAGEKFGGKKGALNSSAQAKRGKASRSGARVRFERARSSHPARASFIPAKLTLPAAEPVVVAAKLSPVVLRPPTEDPLPDTQTSSLYLPSNKVGRPPGKTEMSASMESAATGGTEMPVSSNHSFAVPVAGLSGRGLDVSLALVYNSRVWHKAGNDLFYDVDSGWPAPGFRLGYGQMEDQGAGGFTLTDPDGTRHAMAKTSPSLPYDYDSTDGTFVHFHGGRGWGTATYTDGTRVEYGAAGTNGIRSYPTKITDRNGNYILIGYANGVGPKISSVQDTMGRYVRFYYEGDDLVSVKTPKLGSTTGEENTTIRLYYSTIDFTHGDSNISNLFNPALVTVHAPDTVRVVRYVHFPATNTGYRYDYSPYGMIRQIVQLRNMQPAAFNLTYPFIGDTDDGQWAASTLYNYPATPIQLTDSPPYTTRTDDWVGRTSTPSPPVYTFENSAGLSRIIAPDGSVSETVSIVAPAAGDEWKNGLVDEMRQLASVNGAVLARTEMEWEQGGTNRNPRPKTVWTTNEAGETRAVVYDSYDEYGNVESVTEHKFAVTLSEETKLRRTETDYVTGTDWTSRNLVRLPSQVRVEDAANGAVVSRVDFAYDAPTLVGRGATAVTGHDQAYNPAAPTTGSWQYIPGCDPSVEENCYTYTEVSPYDPATQYRGNVTTVTRYSNAADTQTGTTTNTAKYDILGNQVEQTVNCCRKKTFTYTDTYKYAYPEAETKGDAPLQMTTSATYDFNTGVVRTAKDENLQETSVYYDPVTERATYVERPAGGGRTDFFHEDMLVNGPNATPRYSYSKTVTQFESGRSVESYEFFDGRGAFVRGFGSYTAAQGWATSDVEYDAMGRVLRTSNPYYSGGCEMAINPDNLWTTNSVFDKLGRVTEVTLPDNNKVTSAYAGKVTTVTDQAGKQRRQVADALGRVEEVHEPDAGGSLGVVSNPAQKTKYEYDLLDNLTRVEQKGAYDTAPEATQERTFKYDSLSRLTHQRQVEAVAKLNDEGTVVSSGGAWTKVTKYDAWGLVTEATDARGVRATFVYDTLNRVTGVTYTGGTPAVTYTYDEARNDAQGNPYFNRGRLTSVATAAGAGIPATVQEYDYDRHGRAVAQRQKVGGATYNLSYKYNLAGQLIEQAYPSGKVVKNNYDAAARLLSTTNADGTLAYSSVLTYAAHGGLLTKTQGNGTVEAMEYNARLQLEKLTLKRSADVNAEVLQRYVYNYGQVDQATGAVDATKNTGQMSKIESYVGGTSASATKQWEQRLSYDTLGRLKQSSERRGNNGELSWQATYSYDRFGNRYRHQGENPAPALAYTPVEVGDVDRSTNRFASPAVEYDEAGQVVRDTKFTAKQYGYDANGRVKQVSLLNGEVATTAAYDALGQRVRTASASQATDVVYDIFGQAVAEYGAAEGDGGGRRYLLRDHQGSTRALTKDDGAVAARKDFEPFGEEINANVGQRTAQGYGVFDATRQQYALTERDGETGLDHTWWRKYDAEAGRWTTPDPYLGSMNIGDPQSFNRYSYVTNDPVNFVDPSGLNAEAGGGWSCWVSWSAERQPDGTIVNFRYTSISCTSSGGGGAGTSLNPSQQRKYDKGRSKLLDKLLEDLTKCAKFLVSKGFSLADVREHVGKQRAFSGPESKNLTAYEAGIVPGSAGIGGQSVSQYFESNRPRAAASTFRGNPYDVYFAKSGLNATTILHEALHTLTDKDDIPLADLLGAGKFTDSEKASIAIGKTLKNNGCK